MKSKTKRVKKTKPAKISLASRVSRLGTALFLVESKIDGFRASTRASNSAWGNLRDALYESGIIKAKDGTTDGFEARFKFRADTHVESL